MYSLMLQPEKLLGLQSS